MNRLTRFLRAYTSELVLLFGAIAVCTLFAITQHEKLSEDTRHLAASRAFLSPPLDDVYIHCQFARNLLRGGPYEFTPGQPLTADTSPLWVVLIAVGGLFTSRLELVAIVLSIICYAIIPIGVYRMARDVLGFEQRSAFVAGFLALLTGRLAWSGMSGMETALAALLTLLAVEEHLRSRATGYIRVREALWLGLGMLTRPEFAFVAVVLGADWIISAIQQRADLKSAPLVLFTFIALTAPVILLPLATTGSWIFHSSVVQGAQASFVPNIEYLWFVLKILVANNILLLVLSLYGCWQFAKNKQIALLLIIVIGLPLVQSFVAPQFRHHGRYMFLVLPLIPLVGVAVLPDLLMRLRWIKAKPVVMYAIFIASFFETTRWSHIAANSVRNINDQHLMAVDWLRANMRPTDTLAVQDVGAIGYYLDKPLVDLTGLVTPSLWPLRHNQDSVWCAGRSRGANLFVIYNRLNPNFYTQHKASLVLATEFRVRLPLASSADTVMSVYRLKETPRGS